MVGHARFQRFEVGVNVRHQGDEQRGAPLGREAPRHRLRLLLARRIRWGPKVLRGQPVQGHAEGAGVQGQRPHRAPELCTV